MVYVQAEGDPLSDPAKPGQVIRASAISRVTPWLNCVEVYAVSLETAKRAILARILDEMTFLVGKCPYRRKALLDAVKSSNFVNVEEELGSHIVFELLDPVTVLELQESQALLQSSIARAEKAIVP